MTSEATAQILALITSVLYASALVSARAGMRYSTPTTVTLVSILMQNALLWSAVFATGGVHAVPLAGILLFTVVGIFQLGVRLFAYTGVEKIGASRSSALQSVSPLFSATIAILVLGEQTSTLIVLGTLLVVLGIILVSWKPERQIASFRRWHLLLPIGAAFLTGMNHPIRRYVLTMAHEPLFFSALMGLVSFGAFLIYLVVVAKLSASGVAPPGVVAVSRHWAVRNLFDPRHHHRHQSRAGGYRRADRRQLSGLVADLRGAVSARCRGDQLESDRRHRQRRGGQLRDTFGAMICREQ